MHNYIIYDCVTIAAREEEAVILLHDNAIDFQLRWIQYATADSLAWLIDEIYITCTLFTATKTFEETDRSETLTEWISWNILLLLERFIIFGSALLVMWKQVILPV